MIQIVWCIYTPTAVYSPTWQSLVALRQERGVSIPTSSFILHPLSHPTLSVFGSFPFYHFPASLPCSLPCTFLRSQFYNPSPDFSSFAIVDRGSTALLDMSSKPNSYNRCAYAYIDICAAGVWNGNGRRGVGVRAVDPGRSCCKLDGDSDEGDTSPLISLSTPFPTRLSALINTIHMTREHKPFRKGMNSQSDKHQIGLRIAVRHGG